MSAILFFITSLAGCATNPSPETQTIHISDTSSGLTISWFAEKPDLIEPSDYEVTALLGTQVFEVTNTWAEGKQSDVSGLRKFGATISASDIIDNSLLSTKIFDTVTIRIKADGLHYLDKKFKVPALAPALSTNLSPRYVPNTESILIDFPFQNHWHIPASYTCTLSGDVNLTSVVQTKDLDSTYINDRKLPCYFAYEASDGMKVAVSISATNEYGTSPTVTSEQYTLLTHTSDFAPSVPKPQCPKELSITEAGAKVGDCGTFDVEVFQADLNTGTCTFLANWPQTNGDTAVGIFHFCDVYVTGAFTEGTSYTVSAKVRGTTTYEAQIGGSRTVIEFDLVR